MAKKELSIGVGDNRCKRVPKGFAGDPARGEFLNHGGLYTEQACGKVNELFSPALCARS